MTDREKNKLAAKAIALWSYCRRCWDRQEFIRVGDKWICSNCGNELENQNRRENGNGTNI